MERKNPVLIDCSWEDPINFELPFESPKVELYVDKFPQTPIPEDTKRFIFLLEPPTFLNLYPQAMHFQPNYDYVLTHNEFILRDCPKAVLFEHGISWIKNDYEFKEKNFEISTVVGWKKISEGHDLRHQLYYSQKMIKNPIKFFLSREHQGVENRFESSILGDNKLPLFDSQFHIAIESTSLNNYFTEKLLDCLVTKTVPIYYGCPNIDKWFNPKGMFHCKDVKEIIRVCNSLQPDTSELMREHIEDNFQRAQVYREVNNRLYKKILELLNKL